MAHDRFVPVALLFGVFLCIPACHKKDLPSPESTAPSIAESFGPPPTDAEAKQFASRLQEAVDSNDLGQIDRMLRIEDLLARSVSDLNLSRKDLDDVKRGMSKAMEKAGLGTQILQATANGGSYKLLRTHSVDGRPRVIFRLISNEGAVNYHDFLLARYADGSIGTEDIYLFLSAEMLSQSLRRLLIPALSQMRAGGLKFLRPDEDELVKNMPTIGSMGADVREGRPQAAINKFKQLPQKLQDNKTILLLYLTATAGLGDGGEREYVAAMERFRNLYPRDACIDFISIDYYFTKKKFKEALAAADRVNASVGGDPYMSVLCATMMMELNRNDEARKKIEKALEDEPDLQHGYWTRIELSLREKNSVDTLIWLKKIVGACNVEISDLAQQPQYADFVKSPQFKVWQSWYAKNKNK